MLHIITTLKPAYIGDKHRKMTPLHIAIGRGYIPDEIISHFPDFCDLVDERRWNVLHFAMLSLTYEVLKILLKDPLIRNLKNDKDVDGNTPLHLLATFRLHLSWKIIDMDEARNPETGGVSWTISIWSCAGGVIQDGDNEGTAILSKKAAFQAFVIKDAIAMPTSLCQIHGGGQVVLKLPCFCWVMATGAMVIAFVTGTYAVLTTSLWLAIFTTIIGSSFFILMFLTCKKVWFS
ncbi:hypothetical protein QYF36_004746 [Acer negundo]|nr:hypothetical protein QYF36_004746 [Acer negundo]